MVVRQPELLGIEASRPFEVSQSRSLRKGFDVDEHFCTEALALVDDGLVRDTRKLAEGDDNCKSETSASAHLGLLRLAPSDKLTQLLELGHLPLPRVARAGMRRVAESSEIVFKNAVTKPRSAVVTDRRLGGKTYLINAPSSVHSRSSGPLSLRIARLLRHGQWSCSRRFE